MQGNEICIELSADEMAWCKNHAQCIVAHHACRTGPYNHNDVGSNMVGVKGELATYKWLLSRFDDGIVISKNFEDFRNKSDGKGDISFENCVLEIKGLQPSYWQRFCRMIPPTQLERYVASKAIVIWITATKDEHDGRVCLKGWNYAVDVKEKGVFVQTRCDNIWLKNHADMRSMADLFAAIGVEKGLKK